MAVPRPNNSEQLTATYHLRLSNHITSKSLPKYCIILLPLCICFSDPTPIPSQPPLWQSLYKHGSTLPSLWCKTSPTRINVPREKQERWCEMTFSERRDIEGGAKKRGGQAWPGCSAYTARREEAAFKAASLTDFQNLLPVLPFGKSLSHTSHLQKRKM